MHEHTIPYITKPEYFIVQALDLLLLLPKVYSFFNLSYLVEEVDLTIELPVSFFVGLQPFNEEVNFIVPSSL